MPVRDKTLFLARESYRHRRMIDAARLLPVFGTLLFLVPILWDLAGPRAVDPQAPAGLAQRGLYLFAVWGGLILGAAWLAARLRPVTGPDPVRPVTSLSPDPALAFASDSAGDSDDATTGDAVPAVDRADAVASDDGRS